MYRLSSGIPGRTLGVAGYYQGVNSTERHCTDVRVGTVARMCALVSREAMVLKKLLLSLCITVMEERLGPCRSPYSRVPPVSPEPTIKQAYGRHDLRTIQTAAPDSADRCLYRTLRKRLMAVLVPADGISDS